MDERSRKLLSVEALPKVEVPQAKPHDHREFRLPEGVRPADGVPDLATLRAAALGLGTKPPPLGAAPTAAPAPQVPTVVAAPRPVQAKVLAPVATPSALAERRWPSIATPAPAPAQTPLPSPLPPAPPAPQTAGDPKAALDAGWTRRPDATPTATAPVPAPPVLPPTPAPPVLPPAPPVAARPTPRLTQPPPLKPVAALPPPLPPPPVVVKPPRMQALVVDSGAPLHGERTSMWFKIGDELADERPATAPAFADPTGTAAALSIRAPFWTLRTVAAVAGGGLGLLLLILLV